MTPEKLAELDQHLAAAGDALTAMDDYGLKANAEWLDPLVTGQIAAKKLRAEVERLKKALSEACDYVAEQDSDAGGLLAEIAKHRAENERLQKALSEASEHIEEQHGVIGDLRIEVVNLKARLPRTDDQPGGSQ